MLIGPLVLLSCSQTTGLRADQLAAQGQWDAAVMAYRQALRQEPFDPMMQRQFEEAKVQAAARHYQAGQDALAARQLGSAIEEFKLCLSLDPGQADYHAALTDALRLKDAEEHLRMAEKFQSLGRPDDALAAYERAVALDPASTKALEAITALTRAQRRANMLGSAPEPLTLRFQNAKLKEVFEIVARAGGVNVLFDKEVRDEPITIFIKDTPFEEAVTLILSLHGLSAKRVGPQTLLILPSTKAKQEQYQDLMIRTFYLTTLKAKDLVTLMKGILDTKRVSVNETLNAVVVHDTPAKLQLVERLIQANDRREAEVELDVEVLEVNRTKSLQYGLTFGLSAGAGVVPGAASTLPTASSLFTLQQLTNLSPQSYLIQLPTSVLMNLMKQLSDAKTLANPKLRVLNNKPASVNVGDKQPILLSTTNVLPGQAATGAVPTTSTVTSIDFKDTGVKLMVEPIIHVNDDVTLKLKIDVTNLGDLVTLQASPLIQQYRFGTRSAETTLNLRTDESVVLAGLIQDKEQKTRVTVPWLGDLPILGKLFSSTQETMSTTELVLTITPHIIRTAPILTAEALGFWSSKDSGSLGGTLLVSDNASTGRPLVEPVNAPAAATVAPLRLPTGGASPGIPSPPPPGARTGDPARAIPTSAATVSGTTTPPAPARLSLQPADVTATVGEAVRVDLTADQGTTIRQAQMMIGFDATRLDFQEVLDAGSGLGAAEVAPGQLVVSLQAGSDVAAGPGVLGTMVFRPKVPGDTIVSLPQAAVGVPDAAGPAAIGSMTIHVR